MKKILPVLAIILIASVGLLTMRVNQLSSKETVTPTLETSPEPTTYGPLSKEKLWYLIQEWRKSDDCKPGGCSTYYEDPRLCNIAEDRADDTDLDHSGFYEKYSDFPYRIQENKTGGFSEEDMLKRWLKSPAHAETLRKSYAYSCISVYGNNPDEYYAVQVFSNL